MTTAAIPTGMHTAGVAGRIRRLSWVTWRQQRLAYLATASLFGGLALLLLLQGWQMRDYSGRLGLNVCGHLDSPACAQPLGIFEARYDTWAQYVPRLVLFIPALLGVFVAAPLVGRELENGTFRFAWTQGRTRTEWIVAKLGLIAVPLTGAAVLFSAVFTWWFAPFDPVMGRMSGGQAYEVSGVVFGARTLFALMLGALLGALVRRVVVAMALTGALWVATSWLDIVYLRPLIRTPVAVPADSSLVTRGGWTISEWLRSPQGAHIGIKSSAVADLYRQSRAEGSASFGRWLSGHGYVHWVAYQPDSRFWSFQVTEASGYAVLSIALGLGTVWWVRHRA